MKAIVLSAIVVAATAFGIAKLEENVESVNDQRFETIEAVYQQHLQ